MSNSNVNNSPGVQVVESRPISPVEPSIVSGATSALRSSPELGSPSSPTYEAHISLALPQSIIPIHSSQIVQTQSSSEPVLHSQQLAIPQNNTVDTNDVLLSTSPSSSLHPLQPLMQANGQTLLQASTPQRPTSPASSSKSAHSGAPAKSCPPWLISWWWWWELGAALLSMTSMLLIIVILVKVQDKPLANWQFAIQPNSLISVLTTVGSTSLLVAVTACIGQLKWLYFSAEVRPLDRFQQFDEASRGPWGAAMLIWGVKGRAILACLGAFITLVTLGIDPAAQQILDFPTNTTTLHNVTAPLGMADVYWSKALVSDGETTIVASNPDLLRLQTAIVNGMASTVSIPDFNCTSGATNCYWPDFTTLAVCHTCQDITESVTYNCSKVSPQSNTIKCDYQSPEFREVKDDVYMIYDPRLVDPSNQSTIFATFLTPDGLIAVTPTTPDVDVALNATADAPPVHVELCYWAWCARTYQNVTATPGVLQQNSSVDEILTQAETTTGSDGYTLVTNWIANSTGKSFEINFITNLHFWELITSLLHVTVLTQDSEHPDKNALTSLNFGGTLAGGQIDTIANDISETLTAHLRSSIYDNPNATFLNGTVQVQETYVKVRWPWLILPLTETVLASFLLIASVIVSWGQPLWKNSVTASLVHGLEGWSDEELAVAGYESTGSLDRMAEKFSGKVGRGRNGVLKLLRA